MTVVVPTMGRETLTGTLESLLLQTERADEVIVVSDGPATAFTQGAVEAVRRAPGTWKLLEAPLSRDWGATPRNIGYRLASGELVWCVDDDDQAQVGALALIRSVERFTVFKMSSSAGWTLWADREIRIGNVGTPMLVVPNDYGIDCWGSRYEGDYDFAVASVERFGEPDWRDEVVALIRP